MGALTIFHHNMYTKRHLIGVTPETAPDDGVHVEGFYLVGVLGDHVAQLVPQLVVGLPLLAAIGKHAVSPFYPLKNYFLSLLPIGQIFSLTNLRKVVRHLLYIQGCTAHNSWKHLFICAVEHLNKGVSHCHLPDQRDLKMLVS
jgi:hypothetical protein